MALPLPSAMKSFGNEWLVLLECASVAPDPERFAELLRSADWSRLLALAEEHGVIGHLTARLRETGEKPVPPEIRKKLLERHRAQVFSTLKMTAELFRLLERFDAQGTGALVVKGPVLAVRAYDDPAMRSYSDLDLLVRQRDIRRATEFLIEAGYEAAVPLSSIDAGKIPGQYLFYRPDAKLIVELHNDHTLRYFPRRLPLERYFERRTRVRLDAHDAPALSAEDELALICIHGAKHFWERLMWIADVAALVSHPPGIDWERAFESAAEVGAERILHTGLRLAADLLRARLPEQVTETMGADAVAAQLAAQALKWLPAAGHAPPGLFERAMFRMRMRGGLLSAPAYLLRLSLSPTEEDWNEGTEANRHSFFDALRRPFRLARKYGRGKKA